MKAFFIKEADKLNSIKKLLKFIEIKDNNLIIQRIKPKDKEKHITKLANKIEKICHKNNIENIVISKSLQQSSTFLNTLNNTNIYIFNGKWLFKYMIYEVLEYIMQNKGLRKSETEVSILTADMTNISIELLNQLVREYKRINIITNNIQKFKYLENKIYNEYGIMITVTNNKRKSLEKAEIILNLDFSEEIINQYNINENAIIINVQNEVKIRKKRFNGICVNNYDISSARANEEFEIEKLNTFLLKDLVEERLYRQDTFTNIRKDIINKHYTIKELFGNNGKIFC